MELDLTKAIIAGARARFAAAWPDRRWEDQDAVSLMAWIEDARTAIHGALPELERVIGERLAQQIEVARGLRCPTCGENPVQPWGQGKAQCINGHMWHWQLFHRVAQQTAAIVREQSGGGQ